jgi:hypothetical protein
MGKGINISEAGKRAGISSKRKFLQLLDELVRAGLIRIRKLRERGQPKIIEPILSAEADEMRTKPGRNTDEIILDEKF